MPIKTKKKKNKGQNKHSDIRFTGVLPIMRIKPKKKSEGKIDPHKYVYQESPL